MTLVILVADGARPDTLFATMDAGQLPAIAALRASGSAQTLTTVFPSVTGSAYTPFLMGLHPGEAGLPGLRWYDRARDATRWPAHSRSYVGIGGLHADADLTREHRTLFELEPRSLGGFTYVGRGLDARRRIGSGWAFGARMAWTHFRGDLQGWMRFDRWLGEEFVRRIVAQQPRVAFLAHPGIDKLSHRFGQEDPRVLEAMHTVDLTVAALQRAFADAGRSNELEIWIVSDHGHETVPQHDDLAGAIAAMGLGVRAHPWVIGGRDVAVMVSGNAMAHLYLELERRTRPYWAALRARWSEFRDALLARESVDLVLAPLAADSCAVFARGRGEAEVTLRNGRYAYHRISGDPLGLGEDIAACSADESWDRCRDSAYPDALVQIVANAAAARSGDLILSASAGWDLRARWEPVLHTSGHGALRSAQMLVPFVSSRPAPSLRRTTELFALARERLGVQLRGHHHGARQQLL